MFRRTVGSGVELYFPDYESTLKDVIRRFMPVAGARIQESAKKRLGHYSMPGYRTWPPLARSTVRRKRRMLAQRGFIGDTPLIDVDVMRQSIRHAERGPRETVIMAAFPAHVHEQDPLVAPFRLPPNNLPRREFLWPALSHSIEPLVKDLEEAAVRRM